ncbi:CRP-like cAMP-binding protein [Hydrogenivirga caldilitoris]|uniref:CRP-like cAMP-binding protein n=1 Tax=Hydrogenivirga caldilitoris TaxID=246264 RepID=A0A497XRL2_9AQUI|nr:cyclic nucleotide-binding domain-containing protein [Hydrogenivirga caldilitoris]RLJ70921.1 CRP-like cAMP-binding protein [Hydrogenivirga caldilitoris]
MEPTKLTEELVNLLKNRGKEETYNLGDILIEEGKESDRIFIIEKGYVNVTKKDPMGNDVLIGTAGPGSIIGEMGVFMGVERTATVRAVSDLKVISFGKEEFFEVISSIPEVSSYLIGILTKRLYNLNRRLINAINSKLMIVMGNYIIDKIREGNVQESFGENAKISFDLSTAALETGLDIEKVITALNNLAKAGVLQDYKLIEEVREGGGEGEEKRTVTELIADPQQIKSYLKTISYI